MGRAEECVDGQEYPRPPSFPNEPLAERSRGPFSIRSILFFSTQYDQLLISDEAQVQEVLQREYGRLDVGFAPTIDVVSSEEELLRCLDQGRHDLLIIFNKPSDTDFHMLARKAKDTNPGCRVAALGSNASELSELLSRDRGKELDGVFHWSEDGAIVPALVSSLEDSECLDNGTTGAKPGAALILSKNLEERSRLLTIAHEEVLEHTSSMLEGGLSNKERLNRASRRPIIIAPQSDKKPAIPLMEGADRLLFIVLGKAVEGEDASPISNLSKELPGVPLFDVGQMKGQEWSITRDLRRFIRAGLGEKELVFRDEQGQRIASSRDIRELEIALFAIQDKVLEKAFNEGLITRWLRSRGELELVEEVRRSLPEWKGAIETRDVLSRLLRDHRYRSHMGSVASFQRSSEGPPARFTRIGEGALGGKARTLHFMERLLNDRLEKEEFPGVRLLIPRTCVICTDVFERFMAHNKIDPRDLGSLPDDRIVQRFLSGDMPPTEIGSIRAIVDEFKGPIAVRSSSLLEDALFQPFAGIYASVMLSNSQHAVDQRFSNLCTAIKYVYASTYLNRARSYIASTSNDPLSERMAVLVQEVVGRKRGDLFYPDISGVGRSFDYWPMGNCRSGDGTVILAVGLGKTIVDGANAFRFCPLHPRSCQAYSPRDMLQATQNRFYAIKLTTTLKKVGFNEDIQLSLTDISHAEEVGILEQAASTYSPADDRLYPGTGRDGPRVIDFAPLLTPVKAQLPKLIQRLLTTSQSSLGGPVEIEFAIELEKDTIDLYLLQVRSMVQKGDMVELDEDGISSQELLLSSDRALGNGIMHISDVLLLRSDDLEKGASESAVREISQLNRELLKENRGYMLIGPGRWGSCDPWLGIPVAWGDISGVRVMVELPVRGRSIDPSQGSHFFQNITALRIGYLTISNQRFKEADWDWLMSKELVRETDNVRHLRTDHPLEVRIDGRSGRGLVLKRSDEVQRGS